MAWQPQEETLRQVIHLFKGSHASYSDIILKLAELSELSDFNNYLMLLLTKFTSEDVRLRSMSGLILKNNIIIHYENLPPTVTEFVKSECLTAVGDTSPLIRNVVAIVTSTIASRGINNWPELLPTLCQLLDSADYNVCDGALIALQKIYECSSEYLKDDPQNKILDILIPKFLQLSEHPITKIRSHALGCVNQFILQKTPSLMNNIDVLLKNVFYIITRHDDLEVRKNICRTIVLLLEVSMDRLLPHLNEIIEFMLLNTQYPYESVALEACGFWLSIADQQICKEALTPYLYRIVPILVNKMQYSETEIILLKGNVEEDENVPDQEEDIRSRFRELRNTHGNEEDDSDEEDDGDSRLPDWNLRKCSAAALDALGNVFKDDILPIFMPILEERLSSNEWEVIECGILALGTIAEGCMNGMIPHLNKLIPYMIDHLSDKKALLRTIICWTLSRYSHWVVSQHHEQYLKSMMHGLLKQIWDSNKIVQKAACSAFVILEEEATTELVPYLGFILETLVFALSTFQHKNVSIVYRAIETLADSVGHNLNKPEHINLLLPPLIQKWNVLKDKDKDLYPLFQCLSSIATALQSEFMPYAEPVLEECIQLVEQTKIS